MAGPMITVPSPKRQERKGGIKSVVGEFEALPRLAVANALQWISDGCEFPKGAPGLCYVDVPVTGNKEFEGIDQGTGPIFALYAGVRCYLGPATDYAERARALLTQGEGRAVEEALVEWARAEAAGGAIFSSFVAAIAELEEVADTGYVGQPVLIMSRASAVRARAEKAILGGGDDGQLFTANGTPVIATSAADDDEVYAIGWPTVYASGFTEIETYDVTVNQELAIAERVYGLAVDCGLSHKATVTVTDGGGGGGGAVTLALTTDPVGEAEVGTPVKAHVTVTGEPTEPILLYTQRNAEEPTLVGEMTSLGGGLYELDADTTGLTAGDVYGFYASHGEATAAVRSPIVTVTLTEPEGPPLYALTAAVQVANLEPGWNATVDITFDPKPAALDLWGALNGGEFLNLAPASLPGDSTGNAVYPIPAAATPGDVYVFEVRLNPDDGVNKSNQTTATIVAPALEGWTVAELKQFAADHEPPIPIPSTATKKAEILAIILAFLNASDEES